MKNWNPGHSIGGGYPFAKIESQELFPVPERSKSPLIESEEIKSYVSGIFSALDIAEGQIEDMLHEDPFLPETFGFVLAHKNKDITEAPARIYVNKYDGRFSIFRAPGSPYDKDWSPSMWTLMEKKKDGSLKETNLNLVSYRIAYATFFALGVPVKEEVKVVLDDESSLQSEEDYTHRVVYHCVDSRSGYSAWREYHVTADNDDQAKMKAQEMLRAEVKTETNREALSVLTPGLESLSCFSIMESERDRESFLQQQTEKMKEMIEEDNKTIEKAVFGYKNLDKIKMGGIYPLMKNPALEEAKSKGTSHVVFFKRKDGGYNGENGTLYTIYRYEAVNAMDDKEALTKAKFLLETDTENPVTDVKFEELTIVR